MATISDPSNRVNADEPQIRPPPRLAVGPLAWIRNNLFRSWFDTVLTIIFSLVIVTVITSMAQWVITGANWYIISFNLRQYMIGRYEPEAEWRLQLLLLLVAFGIGFNLATWTRISRFLVILLVMALALAFILPPLITAAIPLPNAYFTASSTDITSGASTEAPPQQIGFIGAAGEKISVQLATDLAVSDEALTGLYSFSDNGSNLLRAAAANRLSIHARIAEIQRLLTADAFTPRQREQLIAELERLEVPPPVTETYAINQQPAEVQILDGATLEPLVSATLDSTSPALELTLPSSGWFVLDKRVVGEGAVLLRTSGIYPLLVREFSTTDTGEGTTSGGGRVLEYVRMTDEFTTRAIRPTIDGRNVTATIIIDNQYRGTRPFSDYLRLFLAPLLSKINLAFGLVLLLGSAGYWGSRFLLRTLDRRTVQRAAIWMLIVLPVLMFMFVYGLGNILPLTDTRRWGGLLLTILLTVVGIAGSFPIGVLLALGRRSSLPVISTFCTLYIEFVRGVPLITVLFMSQLLVPLLNPSLAEVPNAFRAMVGIVFFSAAYLAENVRGGLQSVPHGQEEAAKALGLNSLQVTMYITLPQALRAVIPALMGQFVSLFKDTSLVAIVGLLDLTGISQTVVAQTEFIGLRRESFLFIAFTYFTFSYIMAYVSRRLEETGSGAARRI
jgi:His/Glu/Gln/Arg/opine family amino acid ABC transporter permease subunit